MPRHKWDSKVGTSIYGNIARCTKCGMLKETIRGKLSYFRDDTSKDWAGVCDERLLKGYIEPEFIDRPSSSGGVYGVTGNLKSHGKETTTRGRNH